MKTIHPQGVQEWTCGLTSTPHGAKKISIWFHKFPIACSSKSRTEVNIKATLNTGISTIKDFCICFWLTGGPKVKRSSPSDLLCYLWHIPTPCLGERSKAIKEIWMWQGTGGDKASGVSVPGGGWLKGNPGEEGRGRVANRFPVKILRGEVVSDSNTFRLLFHSPQITESKPALESKVKSESEKGSVVSNFVTPWTMSMEFFRPEYWSG